MVERRSILKCFFALYENGGGKENWTTPNNGKTSNSDESFGAANFLLKGKDEYYKTKEMFWKEKM